MMRALICLSQGVGNVIMATPMIRAVRELGYTVDVFCNARCGASELLRGWDAVEDVYPTWDDLGLLSKNYSVVARGAWCNLAWPPMPIKSRDFVSPDILDMRLYHESAVNMTVARKLGYDGPVPAPHCGYDDPPSSVTISENACVVCPGYGSARSPAWDRKLWPHWPELIDVLTQQGRPVAILGSDADRAVQIPNGMDLRGQLTLRQAAGVLKRADRVIAIDNGLAHMAAALGAPTTVLFGFTSPIKNRPIGPNVTVLTAGLPCRPCQMTAREQTCEEAVCMERIGAADVLEALTAASPLRA